MGYQSAADLRAGYPKFFWELVSPYVSEGIKFLRRTQTGQVWVQNLYANVFKEEHDTEVYGPREPAIETKGFFQCLCVRFLIGQILS